MSMLPLWNLDMLRKLALENQPEIASVRLRTQATAWKIESASLSRMPDLNFNRFFIDDNRLPSVGVGQDAWSLEAMLNIPFIA